MRIDNLAPSSASLWRWWSGLAFNERGALAGDNVAIDSRSLYDLARS